MDELGLNKLFAGVLVAGQKIDEIGARLVVPSGFWLLISTTGVPKYKIGL